MHKRSFVLKPMADVDPDWRHPRFLKTVSQMLSDLPSDVSDRPLFELEDLVLVRELPEDGIKVLYQGVPGAYAQAAMFKFFGEDVKAENVAEWSDAAKAVADGRADYAVLPIENSNAGIVSQVMDILLEYETYIVAEEMLPVKHALMGVPGAKMEDIETVYSHPQALMQCAHYLDERREWRQISLKNTAVSAKKVLEDGDKSQAAIASEISARIYGLELLDTGINDNKNNITRFVILSKKPIVRYSASKISICVELNHEAGALYKLLSYISIFGLNMSKIESRPIPGRNFEYRFFIDFEGNVGQEEVSNALRMIRRASNKFWFLGNY
ncbi:MAG: prephenate dehydratase [Lachnospiraceae bacterium]|nr:prephenate dehydratase [Lachnospiraceae bacterium]